MATITPITLSQLTGGIARAMEDAFRESRFWVIADITNHSFKAEKGYHNFDLVEKESGSSDLLARISGKAWGNGTRQIADFEQKTGQRFTNNIQVLALLAVEYHPVYGISANLLDIDSSFTLGQLEQQKAATLEKLVQQNAFIRKIGDSYITDNNRIALKPVLQRVALLSSSISAGAEDFRHTLNNNPFSYAFALDEYFVSVQGDKNAGQFLDKLIEIYNSAIPYDAVVITRGGGAQTDFLIFDNYRIARAVAKFPIPIITGIGHQKDQTITDLMVHTQTKTPTKAAEFIIAHNRDFEQSLFSFQKDILIASQRLLAINNTALSECKQDILHGARDIIRNKREEMAQSDLTVVNASKKLLEAHNKKLFQLEAGASANARVLLNNKRNEINTSRERLSRVSTNYTKQHSFRITNFESGIKLMSPSNILKKGYALVKVDGKIISNADGIEKGSKVDILLSDTLLQTTVQQKTKHDGTDNNL